MPSQHFHQHQDRSKTNILNQDNACCKEITKSQTEVNSATRQIFILKVDIHNTISDTSMSRLFSDTSMSRLFSEFSLDLY